jgi:predicted enzyme involved in methoxymalonyl-ACP biosynthesis
MLDFNKLKKNRKKDHSGFKMIKVALLGDTATQFIAQAIEGMGVEFSLNIQLFEADFNQIDRQILDLGSELYDFNPEIVLVFESSHKLLQKYNKEYPNSRKEFAYKSLLNKTINICLAKQIKLKTHLLQLYRGRRSCVWSVCQ